jgi:hypothetical protein
VNIEGQPRLVNYDAVAVAGGWLRARVESLPVEVSDGQLNIDFIRGAADFPMINALRVRKSD